MRELRVNATYYAARSYVDFPKNRDVVSGSCESSKFVILVSGKVGFSMGRKLVSDEKSGWRVRT